MNAVDKGNEGEGGGKEKFDDSKLWHFQKEMVKILTSQLCCLLRFSHELPLGYNHPMHSLLMQLQSNYGC